MAKGPWRSGAVTALGAALLFGAGTPLAKALLSNSSPWLVAGLLYLGAGVGLLAWRIVRRSARFRLPRTDLPVVVAAIVCGGVAAPVMLMWGLSAMPATGTSLLLNTEGVFTSLIAWAAFREHVGHRVALGMLAIVGGAIALSWPGQADFSGILPTAAVLAACALWALDNNLTRRVAHNDATWLAMVKGLAAGSVNTALALLIGVQSLPSAGSIVATVVVGFLSYGASLAMFVVSLRALGAARASAYFSVAPFFGASLAIVLLGEQLSPALFVAAVLMALGVWLHLTERHSHPHTHPATTHSHPIDPEDVHHRDVALKPDPKDPLTLTHTHPPTTHSHHHYPDLHHRHSHSPKP